MTWENAYEILKPIPTDDYIGGAWNPIRYAKCKALFELAQQVKDGCIVELGTFRGLGTIALSLGAKVTVYTVDNYENARDFLGVYYSEGNLEIYSKNVKASFPFATPQLVYGDARTSRIQFEQGEVSLLFWDLGIKGRLKEDIAAWLPKLSPDARVAVKDLETGEGFGRAQLVELGLEEVQSFPEGAVYVYQRKKEPTGHVFWIVGNEKYMSEVKVSGNSVKSAMPHLEQIVFLPNKQEHAEWFVECLRLLNKALTQFDDGVNLLWLDSDTFMCEEVGDLFSMLDKFDVVFVHAPGHQTAPTVTPIPECFPEVNIGMICMKNTIRVRKLWETVYRWQVDHLDVFGNNDQAPLREVLWMNPELVRYAIAPAEYNCRFNFGTLVRDRVRILHGRTTNYGEVSRSINANYVEGYEKPPRLWHPNVGAISPTAIA